MEHSKEINKVIIIGLGLLGGSMALEFKRRFLSEVIGIDRDKKHLQKALDLGLIERAGSFSDVSEADIVIIAIPVNYITCVLSKILENINPKTLVFDVGSTKYKICKSVENHPKREQYVAMHPIAGTEFSGPSAALFDLFKNKVNIICDREKTGAVYIEKIENICRILQMKNIFMDSEQHDKHIAYVSHISHISSFMLGKTVLDIEKNKKNIFDMAGSGFESTVRLAKSASKTWIPIFLENQKNVLRSLDEYIKNLKKFRKNIVLEDTKNLEKMICQANKIKKILH